MLNDLKRTVPVVFFYARFKNKVHLVGHYKNCHMCGHEFSSELITKTNYLKIFLLPYSQVLSFHVILSTTIRKKGA